MTFERVKRAGVSRISIRAKVAAALSVPPLALLSLSVFEVREATHEVAQVRYEAQLARAVTGPTGLITSLQDERNWSVVELVGMQSTYKMPTVGYGPTRKATDEALQGFRADVVSKGVVVEATYRAALDALDRLKRIRSDVDRFRRPRSIDNIPYATGIYDRYVELIQGLLDANARIPLEVHDPELRQGTELASMASHQAELSANISRTTVVAAVISPGGVDSPVEISGISRLLGEFEHNNDQIKEATGRYADVVRTRFPQAFATTLRIDVHAAVETGRLDDLQSFLHAIAYPPEQRYEGLRDAIFAVVIDRADQLTSDASTRQRIFVSLVFATFGAAAAMTWLVSRSITGPLQSLTRQATDMAEHRLPEAVLDILETPIGRDVRVPRIHPVGVGTRDEVADVSDALNTVQTSAVDLAVEQAMLRRNMADAFVNMGRRNQDLLGRQLAFITQLESQEIDPDTLSVLFRLDHLATRMRRNAESLLVLANIEPPRKWQNPVALVDVIRAALGEVEDFQRVRIARVDPVTIVGSAAADLAHLLAELIENSLVFSAPDQVVDIYGRDRANGYTLVSIDHGIGMHPDDLARANKRLAGTESFTVAPSKYLGHYVAGALAARHDIHIQLSTGADKGTMATFHLPPGVVQPPAGHKWTTPRLAPPPPARPTPQPPVRPTPLPPVRPMPQPPVPVAPPAPAAAPAPASLVASGSGASPPAQPPSTPAGLTRRTRGAQLPVTEPVQIRRGTGGRDGRPGDRGPRAARRSDVYAFLANFTAGIPRGQDRPRRNRWW
jgi:signal transduction histidine kinase